MVRLRSRKGHARRVSRMVRFLLAYHPGDGRCRPSGSAVRQGRPDSPAGGPRGEEEIEEMIFDPDPPRMRADREPDRTTHPAGARDQTSRRSCRIGWTRAAWAGGGVSRALRRDHFAADPLQCSWPRHSLSPCLDPPPFIGCSGFVATAALLARGMVPSPEPAGRLAAARRICCGSILIRPTSDPGPFGPGHSIPGSDWPSIPVHSFHSSLEVGAWRRIKPGREDGLLIRARQR